MAEAFELMERHVAQAELNTQTGAARESYDMAKAKLDTLLAMDAISKIVDKVFALPEDEVSKITEPVLLGQYGSATSTQTRGIHILNAYKSVELVEIHSTFRKSEKVEHTTGYSVVLLPTTRFANDASEACIADDTPRIKDTFIRRGNYNILPNEAGVIEIGENQIQPLTKLPEAPTVLETLISKIHNDNDRRVTDLCIDVADDMSVSFENRRLYFM